MPLCTRVLNFITFTFRAPTHRSVWRVVAPVWACEYVGEGGTEEAGREGEGKHIFEKRKRNYKIVFSTKNGIQ